MKTWMASALGLTLLAAPLAASAQPAPVVLTCSIARPASAALTPGAAVKMVPADRTFRIGKGSFQEWSATDKAFGRNLCQAYRCATNQDKTEGTIGSASVEYTIGVDNKTGAAYWRSQGATGFAETEGPCRKVADPSKH